jgi:hypothetical protein
VSSSAKLRPLWTSTLLWHAEVVDPHDTESVLL